MNQNNNTVCDNITCEDNKNIYDVPILDWTNADFKSLCNMIESYNWANFFECNLNVETLWDNFKAVVWPMIYMFVPTKKVKHYNKYKTRQYPKEIRKLISRKRAIWRVMKINNNPELKSKYRTLTLEINLAIQKFDMDREKKILDSNNLGTFYKFLNNKLSCKKWNSSTEIRGWQYNML